MWSRTCHIEGDTGSIQTGELTTGNGGIPAARWWHNLIWTDDVDMRIHGNMETSFTLQSLVLCQCFVSVHVFTSFIWLCFIDPPHTSSSSPLGQSSTPLHTCDMSTQVRLSHEKLPGQGGIWTEPGGQTELVLHESHKLGFWCFSCISNYHNCQHSHLKHPCNGGSRHRDFDGWHTGLHSGRRPEQVHRASHTAVHHYHPNSPSLHHNARLEAHTEPQSHS